MAGGSPAPWVQRSLRVGSSDDPLEREADRVAGAVVGSGSVPAVAPAARPTIQRMCNACEEEQMAGAIQPALRPGARGEVSAGVARSLTAQRGQGHALPGETRAYFESRMGQGFGDVRVHHDEETTSRLGARAFTHGSDLYFAPGEYSPSTDGGKRLLAHELTHVVQQRGGATPDVQRQETSPQTDTTQTTGGSVGPPVACDISENNPVLWFEYNSDRLRNDGTIDSAVHLASMIGRVRRHFDLASSAAQLTLMGYASEEGAAPHNLELSQRRADRVRELLVLAGLPGERITARGLGESRAMPGLPLNRRVEICLTPPVQNIEMEPVTVEARVVDCANPPARVDTLSQYAFLIRCVERALPTFGPRDILSTLRRFYYGSSFFNDAIPCGTMMGVVGPMMIPANLRATLQASKVVEGVDVGHIFTGLDAMMCPSSSVELEVTGPNPVIAMSNEDFVTWGGDLGSAAAHKAFDEIEGRPQPWSAYFGNPDTPASAEDLRGDIDPFVMRAGLLGRCATTREWRLPALTSPLSSLFLDYYGGGSVGPGAVSDADRIRCFVEALGGVVVGGRITNKTALVNAMRPQVRSFADVFYLGLYKRAHGTLSTIFFSGGPAPSMLRLLYSWQVSEMFVDWLESQL